jgi:hypothetical protein
MHGHIIVKKILLRTGRFMSTIRNAILNWADTPGIEIQELTESRIGINTPWGSAILTLKDDPKLPEEWAHGTGASIILRYYLSYQLQSLMYTLHFQYFLARDFFFGIS